MSQIYVNRLQTRSANDFADQAIDLLTKSKWEEFAALCDGRVFQDLQGKNQSFSKKIWASHHHKLRLDLLKKIFDQSNLIALAHLFDSHAHQTGWSSTAPPQDWIGLLRLNMSHPSSIRLTALGKLFKDASPQNFEIEARRKIVTWVSNKINAGSWLHPFFVDALLITSHDRENNDQKNNAIAVTSSDLYEVQTQDNHPLLGVGSSSWMARASSPVAMFDAIKTIGLALPLRKTLPMLNQDLHECNPIAFFTKKSRDFLIVCPIVDHEALTGLGQVFYGHTILQSSDPEWLCQKIAQCTHLPLKKTSDRVDELLKYREEVNAVKADPLAQSVQGFRKKYGH